MSDDGAPDDDLEVDIRLRSPRDVADRLIVLGALCRRSFLEATPQAVAGDDPEAERFDLTAWLGTEGLDQTATESERRVLHTPVGRLPDSAAVAASWQTEALAALGWALAAVDAMPPYDSLADPTALLQSVPAPWEGTAPFRRAARLRPEAEIARERERAELWRWRAEVADALTTADPADRRDLVAAVRDVAAEARNLGLLTELRQTDFPARGLPYRDLDPESRAELALIAAVRSHALDWLCGLDPSWGDGLAND